MWQQVGRISNKILGVKGFILKWNILDRTTLMNGNKLLIIISSRLLEGDATWIKDDQTGCQQEGPS